MGKTKKQRRKEKAERALDRKILARYPFLEARNVWTGRRMVPPYPEIRPDENGWMKAFFWQMMDEIKESLIRTGCMESFHILQFKEKYGTMRFYVSGCKDETYRIIDRYEVISANTCEYCGRPDVGIVTRGWITPVCRKCYAEKYKGSIPYEEAVDMEDTVIRDTYTIHRFSADVPVDTEYDLTSAHGFIRGRMSILQDRDWTYMYPCFHHTGR